MPGSALPKRRGNSADKRALKGMKTLRQRYVSGRRGDDETNPRRNQTGQHVPLVIDPGGPSARSVYVTNEIGMCFVGRHAALLAGEKHNVACPSSLISASNFFELARRGRHQPVQFQI